MKLRKSDDGVLYLMFKDYWIGVNLSRPLWGFVTLHLPLLPKIRFYGGWLKDKGFNKPSLVWSVNPFKKLYW